MSEDQELGMSGGDDELSPSQQEELRRMTWSEDWIKTMPGGWDLYSGVGDNMKVMDQLPELMEFLGVLRAPVAEQWAEVAKFTRLPAFTRAPEPLRTEALRFVETGKLPEERTE